MISEVSNMMRPQRHGSWSAQDDLKVGRHTVRLKRSLGEGGFAFIHLVEVRLSRLLALSQHHQTKRLTSLRLSIQRMSLSSLCLL